MLKKVASVLVCAIAVAAIGCAGFDSSGPSGTVPAQPGYAAQGAGEPAVPESATYRCFALSTARASGTLCFGADARCESERAAARADGATTSECAAREPVSCFQLGGDPNPSLEMCAATPYDCELWRFIDHDRNGATDSACEWRHGTAAAQPAPAAE